MAESKRSSNPEIEIEVTLSEVEDLGISLLEMLGVERDLSRRLMCRLVDNELAGYPSHGLLRLPEYLRALESGTLVASARPSVVPVTDSTRVVDGSRCFGLLAAEKVIEELCALVQIGPFGAVALRNSHHLGRLHDIGWQVACRGYVVLGFVNCLGKGQKVPPWRGSEGRFCTNPLLFAAPTRTDPVVVDMSTSAASEGAVRAARIAGTSVPQGWLVDRMWNSVTEPRLLYERPATAMLAPLGDLAGHKGFALSLTVEILAGVITGSGFSARKEPLGGNGGFFLIVDPELFGCTRKEVVSRIESLAVYCRRCPVPPGSHKVRLPGQATIGRIRAGRIRGLLKVGSTLWRRLELLAECRG